MPAPSTTGANMSYPSSVDAGPAAPWALNAAANVAAGGSTTLTGNTVYCAAVDITGPCIITGVRFKTGATITGTVDVGIYDASGNLLAHTGVQTPSTSTTQALSFTTALGLAPGRYLLAMCPSNSTDTYFGTTGLAPGAHNGCTATSAGTAGVLPATTGTLVASSTRLICEGVISGGLP